MDPRATTDNIDALMAERMPPTHSDPLPSQSECHAYLSWKSSWLVSDLRRVSLDIARCRKVEGWTQGMENLLSLAEIRYADYAKEVASIQKLFVEQEKNDALAARA
jgi:hypothetical protein